ncbi:MAG: hypothetical protein PHC97_00655 [Patescibacteria group bacterium]|nr:hypothetical protein [Patescibacteria group bacterium]
MKKKYLKKILPFLITLSLFAIILVTAAIAADNSYGLNETAGQAGLNINITAAQFLGQIAGAALAIAGSLFLFLIIYGGIRIMTAAGKEEQVKKGKEIITWAIIGAIVLGAAYAITSLVFQAISGAGK